MTGEHVIFIPGVLMVGMFLGFILGTRAARNQFELAQRRAAEREATREARKAASKQGAATKSEDGPS